MQLLDFSLLDGDTVEAIKLDTVAELKTKRKFYYKTRFIIALKPWTYMGKTGVSLKAVQVQGEMAYAYDEVEVNFIA